jgi:hypothetical protein
VDVLEVFFFLLVDAGFADFFAAGFFAEAVLVTEDFDVVFDADLAVGFGAVAIATRSTPVSPASLLARTSLIADVCSPSVIRNSWWPSGLATK